LIQIGTSKGPIVNVKLFLDNMAELKRAAGIESWPHNGLRHSFGSYHLAYHGDAMKKYDAIGGAFVVIHLTGSTTFTIQPDTNVLPQGAAANGFNNLQCYWLGRDPTNLRSTFKAQAAHQPGTGYPLITWNSVGAKTYALE
jgi:hypothetical protein